MPNRLRAKANGRMVYSVPLIIFLDDVSGNISKQWNKHHVVYLSNALLPRQMLDKQFCVRFYSTSPHASPIEFMHALRDNIAYVIYFPHQTSKLMLRGSQVLESGVETYDCKENEEVLLIPYGLFFGSDNPMQAIQCSHAGLSSNHFCRICKVGGTKKYKASEEGYSEIFTVSSNSPLSVIIRIRCRSASFVIRPTLPLPHKELSIYAWKLVLQVELKQRLESLAYGITQQISLYSLCSIYAKSWYEPYRWPTILYPSTMFEKNLTRSTDNYPVIENLKN